jgi:predicted ATPase
MGELSPAREQLEQGIALYDPAQHRIQDPQQDLGVGCFSQVAPVLWLLGYPDQALQRSQEALALARDLSHPFSIAYALGYASRVHAMRKEQQAALELLEEQIALASEQGFELFMARETLWRGRVLSEQGRVEEGIAQMRQGLVAHQATGSVLGRPFMLAWLAEAYGKVGQVEEGLTAVAEALTAVDTTGERVQEAELHRLRGELHLQHAVAQQEAAEFCFQQALAVARHQQAKSWELRAATSLSRLWQQQGKRAAAYDLLVPVYGWFTEGFDTADLQEAKVLLEALRA